MFFPRFSTSDISVYSVEAVSTDYATNLPFLLDEREMGHVYHKQPDKYFKNAVKLPNLESPVMNQCVR